MRGLPRLLTLALVVAKTHLRIAVVDDEEPVRKALTRLMRAVGLSVEMFGSGAEFLKSLETRLPDCVVLDLQMPHMDGFNVQAHLARKWAALPVIIVTGHDFPKARDRAMAKALEVAEAVGATALVAQLLSFRAYQAFTDGKIAVAELGR